jgi:hypothetical protein
MTPHPYRVLAFAALLPGCGHVALGLPQRGLVFLFFILVGSWLSHHLMPVTSSFVGHNIGGIFIYGMSVIDAYRTARVRYEEWKLANGSGDLRP